MEVTSARDGILQGPEVVFDIPHVSLGEYFLSTLERHGDKVAQIQQIDGVEVKVTYSDLLRDGKTVTALLREYGLDVGDTVMLFCGNTLDFLPIMMGTQFAGVTLCTLNTELDSQDIQKLIDSIKPQLIISNKNVEQNLHEALSKCEVSTPVISLETVAELLKDMKGSSDVIPFTLGKVVDPANEVALIMCSSGTSGTPKGVEMTHRYVLHLTCSVKDMSEHIHVMLNMSGPYWLSCLGVILFSFRWGTTTVLLNNFQEDLFLETVQNYKVNMLILGPNHLVDMAKYGSTEKYDLTNLRVLLYGGSSMSPNMLNLAQKNLRTPITLTYGMTECFGMFAPAFTVLDKPGNVGPVGPNVTVKVVDIETGKAVGPYKEGEICVKSSLTFKGYRGNPEASKDTFDKDGFLLTGDIGYYDNDGYFYIVDRLKDLFKYKGIHVNPVDIEDVLLQHNQVLHAAVVGMMHDEDQTHSTAFVVRRPAASVTEQELLKFVEDKLPSYKWLYGGVNFVEVLPRTASGKINKNKLKTQYLGQLLREKSTSFGVI